MSGRPRFSPPISSLFHCFLAFERFPKIVACIAENIEDPGTLLSLSLVCRTFQPVVLGKLWAKPKFSTYRNFEQFVNVLSSPSPTAPYQQFIERLHLDRFPELEDAAFKELQRCENLTYLDIPRCLKLTNPTLQSTFSHFHSLTVVDVEGLKLINDDSIISLARNNTGLQGVKLSGCTSLTDRSLLFLGNYCPNLREVFLAGIPQITGFGLRYLLVRCSRIQTLDISQCGTFVDDEILHLIWATQPTLRKLHIAGCHHVTDQAFANSAKVLTGTTYAPTVPDPDQNLPPGWNASIHLPAQSNIPAWNLKQLDLTDCATLTDEAVRIFTVNSPRLSALVLKNCSLLTDLSIRYLTVLGKHVGALVLAKLSKITDDSVEELCKHCKRLKNIDLSGTLTIATIV